MIVTWKDFAGLAAFCLAVFLIMGTVLTVAQQPKTVASAPAKISYQADNGWLYVRRDDKSRTKANVKITSINEVISYGQYFETGRPTVVVNMGSRQMRLDFPDEESAMAFAAFVVRVAKGIENEE